MINEIYDNPVINVNGSSKERLTVAMSLALKDKAVGWAIDPAPKHRMVFFWADPSPAMNPQFNPFPTPINTARMADYAWDWLDSLPKDAWDEPDGDIWLKRGWRVYTDMWGHIEGYHWQSFIAVEPYSLWVGK